MQTLVVQLNRALSGRARVTLRTPDPTLGRGTPHGYLAAVQRDRKELFADQIITGDLSVAVPALEIMFFQGEGAGRTGRQVVQLAGVQASTSYGIACTYGRKADGTCAASGDPTVDFGGLDGDGGGAGDGGATFIGGEEAAGGPLGSVLAGAGREGILTRLLRAVPRALAEALRLLFNNPRELGLLAALWALLYAPCYLGDRRRAVREIAARRLSGSAVPS
jgi:hypothetical protein